MINKQSRPPVSMAEGRQEENSSALWSGATDAGYFEAILPRGSENAVSTAALLELTGIRTARRLRMAIADAREAGAVILSSASGYFLPADGEKGRKEAEAFIATITAKGAATIRAADSARAFLAALPGQMKIGGGTNGETESGG